MTRANIHIYIILGLVLFSITSYAQSERSMEPDSARVDSIPVNEDIYDVSYRLQRYFLPFENPSDTIYRDSLLDLSRIHQRDFWVWDRADNGGAFAPYYTFTRSEKIRIGPRLGFDRYMSQLANMTLPMYEASKPVTQLYYCMGPKVEQDFMAWHTNNITPRLNIGLKLKKNYAPGFYSGQMNNHSIFKTNTHWRSKNLRWQNENYYHYLKLDYFENGGLSNDSSFGDADFSNLRLFDVPFSDNRLVANQNQSNWRNQHHFSKLKTVWRRVNGQSEIQYNEDSTQTRYRLLASSYWEWDVSRARQRFQTLVTRVDSVKLAQLQLSGTDALDSLQSDIKYTQLLANMSFVKNYLRPNSTYLLRLGMGYQWALQNSVFDTSQYHNILLHPEFQWQNKRWLLNADLQFYVLGDFAGDYLLKANLIAPWKGFRQELDFCSYLSSAGSFQSRYRISGAARSDALKAELGQRLKYRLEKDRWRLGLDFHQIQNMIYLEPATVGMYHYQNLDKGTQVLKISAGYAHENMRWGYRAEASLLSSAANYPYGIPDWMAQAQVYMLRKLFQSRMILRTGFQIDYLAPYASGRYDLLANDFSRIASPIKINKYNLQYYFNFRISRAKVFILVSQINQVLLGNYTTGTVVDYALNQPYRFTGSDNFSLRLGISWLMIN